MREINKGTMERKADLREGDNRYEEISGIMGEDDGNES